MTHLRTFSIGLALTAASLLAACTTAPSMPMAHASAAAATPAGSTAMMDAHMKTMREQHERMKKARTPQERQALMADHMKAMQGGMAMMQGGGMGGAGGMQGMKVEPGSPQHHMMLEQRMKMMEGMMEMMMDRLPGSEHAH